MVEGRPPPLRRRRAWCSDGRSGDLVELVGRGVGAIRSCRRGDRRRGAPPPPCARRSARRRGDERAVVGLVAVGLVPVASVPSADSPPGASASRVRRDRPSTAAAASGVATPSASMSVGSSSSAGTSIGVDVGGLDVGRSAPRRSSVDRPRRRPRRRARVDRWSVGRRVRQVVEVVEASRPRGLDDRGLGRGQAASARRVAGARRCRPRVHPAAPPAVRATSSVTAGVSGSVTSKPRISATAAWSICCAASNDESPSGSSAQPPASASASATVSVRSGVVLDRLFVAVFSPFAPMLGAPGRQLDARSACRPAERPVRESCAAADTEAVSRNGWTTIRHRRAPPTFSVVDLHLQPRRAAARAMDIGARPDLRATSSSSWSTTARPTTQRRSWRHARIPGCGTCTRRTRASARRGTRGRLTPRAATWGSSTTTIWRWPDVARAPRSPRDGIPRSCVVARSRPTTTGGPGHVSSRAAGPGVQRLRRHVPGRDVLRATRRSTTLVGGFRAGLAHLQQTEFALRLLP